MGLLEADGVDGITTTCGFLSLFQAAIAEAVSVPVVTSSLMQVAQVNRMLAPGRRAGILTISASSLTAEHLECAGVPGDTTADALARLERDVLVHEPGVVCLTLGGNDLLRQLPADDAFANLEAIVRRLQDAGALVVVAACSSTAGGSAPPSPRRARGPVCLRRVRRRPGQHAVVRAQGHRRESSAQGD